MSNIELALYGWPLVTLILFTDMVIYDLVLPFLGDYVRQWNIGERELGLLFGA